VRCWPSGLSQHWLGLAREQASIAPLARRQD
jgi:hypothetical protein